MNPLQLAAARRALELILPEDLPGVATEALEDGLDSPSLRILAGLTRSEIDEAWSLFDRTLTELNLEVPSLLSAVLCLSRSVAREIVSGRISPREGSSRISRLVDALPRGEHSHVLDTFLYADSEWDDRPEDAEVFEKGVMEAARDLVRWE
jgi:hypothetical protein